MMMGKPQRVTNLSGFRKTVLLIAVTVIFLAFLSAGWVWYQRGKLPLAEAVLSGRVAGIGPSLDGKIKSVAVQAGQKVNEGDLILRLDEKPILDLLNSALKSRKQLESRLPRRVFQQSSSPFASLNENELRQLIATKANDEQNAKGLVTAASTNLAQARLAVAKFTAKPPRTPKEQAELAEARNQLTNAEAAMKVADEDFTNKSLARAQAESELNSRLKSGSATTANTPDVQEALAEYKTLLQVEEQARLALKNLEIYSPLNGFVNSVSASDGQIVSAGNVYVQVASENPDDYRVFAYTDQKGLEKLVSGQHCAITLEDGTELDGFFEKVLRDPLLSEAKEITGPAPVKANQGGEQLFLLQIGLIGYQPQKNPSGVSGLPVSVTVNLRNFVKR